MNTDKTAVTDSRTVAGVYWIEKLFIGGPLKGLRWEGATTTKFDVGFVCRKPIGNTSPYRIISCVEKPLYPNQ